MTQLCAACVQGAQGETGHAGLEFYVTGPYPGQQIYKCKACDERWIRHHGGSERFGWTRYAVQYPGGIRQPTTRTKHDPKLPV